jgi:hypothetical protein
MECRFAIPTIYLIIYIACQLNPIWTANCTSRLVTSTKEGDDQRKVIERKVIERAVLSRLSAKCTSGPTGRVIVRIVK